MIDRQTIEGVNGPLRFRLFSTIDSMGDVLAGEILQGVMSSERPHYILGLPTGSTPLPVFRNLALRMISLSADQKQLIAQRLRFLVMDDFVDSTSNENIDILHEWSAVGFMDEHLIQPLNKALSPYSLDKARILYPKVGEVASLRDQIIGLGGLDLQVIATDPFEGHVAQNYRNQPPEKSEADKISSLSSDFIKHHPWAQVFRGVTFDLRDFQAMVSANKEGMFALIITGDSKRDVLVRFLSSRQYQAQLPVSFLWSVPERTVLYTDLADVVETFVKTLG